MGGGRVAPNPSTEVDVYNPGTNTWTTDLPFIDSRGATSRPIPTASATSGCQAGMPATYHTTVRWKSSARLRARPRQRRLRLPRQLQLRHQHQLLRLRYGYTDSYAYGYDLHPQLRLRGTATPTPRSTPTPRPRPTRPAPVDTRFGKSRRHRKAGPRCRTMAAGPSVPPALTGSQGDCEPLPREEVQHAFELFALECGASRIALRVRRVRCIVACFQSRSKSAKAA